MTLLQPYLDGKTKIDVAIMRLQEFCPPEGYYLAFSGGKDSVVIYDLAIKSGVKFDAHYNITGVDPPELVYFIRENYPDMIYEKPLKTMWKLVEEKGLPLRFARFCCKFLKEYSGKGRTVMTGIRAQESRLRAWRPLYNYCKELNKKYLQPIIDWTEEEVWEYIHLNQLPYCKLYDEGFKRLGCILCPFTSKERAEIELKRWPKIADAWYRACERHLANAGHESDKRWLSAREMFDWWLSREKIKGDDDCQSSMFV